MRYLLCWIFPPFGMLACNRPGLAFIAFLLCCSIIGYLPAAIWSYIVAAEFYANERNDKLVRALGGSQRSDSRRSRREVEESDEPFNF